MTPSNTADGDNEDNGKESEKDKTTNLEKSYRAEFARKSHNTVEKKRKDKIGFWISKISELLPRETKKESKNGILEKAFHYMMHLKEMNDKLLYENADQIRAEELRLTRKRLRKMEETNAVYYKLLKMSGITPNNIPIDAFKHQAIEHTLKLQGEKSTQIKRNENASGSESDDEPCNVGLDKRKEKKDGGDGSKNQQTNHQNGTNSNELSDGNPLIVFQKKPPLLVVNQNLDQNAPRISLSNGSQLQIRPSPNVQILGNGALAIDNSSFNQGQIILGSTLLNPAQPTTLLMSNGQLVSLVNPPQPAFVYTPGAGFVLTSPTTVSNQITTPVTKTPALSVIQNAKNKPSSTLGGAEQYSESSDKKMNSKRPKMCLKQNLKESTLNEASDEDLPDSVVTEKPPRAKKKITKTVIKSKVTSSRSNNLIKRPRLTTVIERVTDSPLNKTESSKTSRESKETDRGSIIKELENSEILSNNKRSTGCDNIATSTNDQENRMSSYPFSGRHTDENGEAQTCEQDQLPLLLDSLSDDNEMSAESVHSVSNSSLPTFLSNLPLTEGLSPSDHLTEFLSKSDHGNHTSRSPRYSSPIPRINNTNTNNPISQNSTVIMSNTANCHQSSLLNDNNINQHHAMISRESIQNHPRERQTTCEPNQINSTVFQSNNSEINNRSSGQETERVGGTETGSSSERLYEPQASRRAGKSKSPVIQQTEIALRKSYHGNNNNRDAATGSASTNPSSTNQESISSRNFLPYSAESLLRQQPQHVPINSIYHVHSNVTVDPNIDFNNRVTAPSTNTNSTGVNSSSNRPSISYSAERLIHSPSVDNSLPSSHRHKTNDVAKETNVSSNSNVYNDQYSMAAQSRATSEIETRHPQLTNHQHVANAYRSSPPSHHNRANQDQHQPRNGSNSLSSQSSQAQQQQMPMMHQRSSYSDKSIMLTTGQIEPHNQASGQLVYSDSDPHNHHQQQQSSQASQQQSRGSSQTHQPQNQSNTNSQAQISLKTGPTNNNSTTSSSRDVFNHYPYGSSANDNLGNERNSNIINFAGNGNGQAESFIESNPSAAQSNLFPSFGSSSNYQPSIPTNNRRSNHANSAVNSFSFSDPLNTSSSFPSNSLNADHYSRPHHGSSVNSLGSAETNRRIANSSNFELPSSSSVSTPNSAANNYFLVHHNHHATSSLQTSNNPPPPIFSTSSTFPGLISSSANSSFDNNGYLTTSSRSNASSNTNISNSANTFTNSNIHHHHHPHHAFFTDSAVSSLPVVHSRPKQTEPVYSSNSKTVNGSNKNSGNSNGKQSAKNIGGSSKSSKKGSTNTTSKSRQASSNDLRSSSTNSGPASYSTMGNLPPGPAPPPPPTAIPNHNLNLTNSSALNMSSSERPGELCDNLFRPQSQSSTNLSLNHAPNNMQSISTATSAARSSGPTGQTALPSVGHSSSFIPNFSFSNIFSDISSTNLNDNFAMSGLSAIKFPTSNHVLPHPNHKGHLTHSSALQVTTGPIDNSTGPMGDSSSHQNIYGHHGRIGTPHHNHMPFIPIIGTSTRTLK